MSNVLTAGLGFLFLKQGTPVYHVHIPLLSFHEQSSRKEVKPLKIPYILYYIW